MICVYVCMIYYKVLAHMIVEDESLEGERVEETSF